MNLRVVYFAAARDLAGCGEEAFAFPAQAPTLAEFVSWLGDRRPRLSPYLARMRFALNGEFADSEARLGDGDEVAVLPPVAGGAGELAAVRDEPLSIDEVLAAVRQPSAGGIALFVGTVRDHHRGQPVERLDYEAYRLLAEKEMRRIVEALMAAHVGTRVAAVHRVGELVIGDTAVIVAASAAHRDEAFALCRAAVDQIKERVPIWKREWAPDGRALWVNLERDERT